MNFAARKKRKTMNKYYHLLFQKSYDTFSKLHINTTPASLAVLVL